MDQVFSRRQVGRLAAAGLAAGLLVRPGVARATHGPLTTWYFAEGYTADGFDTFLTILNPTGTPAACDLRYFLAGKPAVTKGITVPARSRGTVSVHDGVQGVGRGEAVSTLVTRTDGGGDIYVERPMYFSYTHPGEFVANGGHNVLGATEPRSTWYFAEGYTETGFDEYLVILNPNYTQATVNITYYTATGSEIPKTVYVPARRRKTVNVFETAEGVGRGQAVSARVACENEPIVVERPIYFSYNGSMGQATGGHTIMGSADARLL